MRHQQSIKIFLIFLFSTCCVLSVSCRELLAGENKLNELSKQIVKAKDSQDLFRLLEELKELYFKDNKYYEFVEFLHSLGKQHKNIGPFENYYVALARYQQLKYLEKEQIWDEYFDKGNDYRQELITNAEKAISATQSKDKLHLLTQLILWQFHKDMEDAFVDQASEDLMDSVLEYSKTGADIEAIKEIADKFLSYGEKRKSRQVYKIYVDKLTTVKMSDKKLADIARGFYEEENLELAQTIYDVYIDRVVKSMPKEEVVPLLIDLAKLFAYKDKGLHDVYYAEKIFKELEDIGGREAFDEALLYLRSYNSEKAKEFSSAKDSYIDLIRFYPKTAHSDEAHYKLGIIFTYALRDMKSGKVYFEELVKREINFTPQVISGLYQLGLLSQWEGNLTEAKEYYDRLIELAGRDFRETVILARKRLNEIDEGEPIEYNLKTFLDASLKDEYSTLDIGRVDLKALLYKPEKNERVQIGAGTYSIQSGCFPVDLQYLWSGHTGKTTPSTRQSSFETSYSDAGTKEIFLVIVSPTGVLERSFTLLDPQ